MQQWNRMIYRKRRRPSNPSGNLSLASSLNSLELHIIGANTDKRFNTNYISILYTLYVHSIYLIIILSQCHWTNKFNRLFALCFCPLFELHMIWFEHILYSGFDYIIVSHQGVHYWLGFYSNVIQADQMKTCPFF